MDPEKQVIQSNQDVHVYGGLDIWLQMYEYGSGYMAYEGERLILLLLFKMISF